MPYSIFNQLDEELKKDFEIIQTYHVPTSQSVRQDVLVQFKSYIPRMSLYQNWKTVMLEDHCKILSLQEYNPFQSTLVFSKLSFSIDSLIVFIKSFIKNILWLVKSCKPNNSPEANK